MIYIVVDDQQAKLITESSQGIEIRDKAGKHLGFVAHGFSEEDLAVASHRLSSSQPRISTEKVIEHLRALEVQ